MSFTTELVFGPYRSGMESGPPEYRTIRFGDNFPPDGEPSLVIDFVGGLGLNSLALDFLSEAYTVFDKDPADPAGFVMIEVWQ